MPNPIAVTLHALAATAAGTATGAAVPIATGTPRSAARLEFDLPELAGTDPELTIRIETAPALAGPYAVRRTASFKARTNEPRALTVGGLQAFLRVSYTLAGSGSPSATWSLGGEAHQIYCEPRDIITYAVPPASIEKISEYDRIDACIADSARAEGWLSGSFEMPIVSWGLDLRANTAALVAATLFARRGVDPQGPDAGVFKAADDVRRDYFKLIAAGKLKPPGIIDSTPEVFEGGGYVVSRPPRGWSS